MFVKILVLKLLFLLNFGIIGLWYCMEGSGSKNK